MTPDPSGAARAPQTLAELLAEVRAAISDRLQPFHPIAAREWLGALVQAVEDQQKEVSRLRADGQRLTAEKWIEGLTGEQLGAILLQVAPTVDGRSTPTAYREELRQALRAALAAGDAP